MAFKRYEQFPYMLTFLEFCILILLFCLHLISMFVLLCHEKLDTLIEAANLELEKIVKYMESNKLLISKPKCNYMIVPPKPRQVVPPTCVKLGTDEISKVCETTFLGLIIDDRMTFRSQIEKVKNKLRSGIGALTMVRNCFNYKAKLALYNGLIKPYLDYGFLVYGDCLNKGQMATLEVLQKKAVRIIFNARFNTHSSQLFALSNITPIRNMYKKESLIFMKKYELGKQPTIFNEIIGKICTDSRLRSNQSNKIQIDKNLKKGNLLYSMFKAWNDSELPLRECSSINSLKKNLKELQRIEMSQKICTKRKCYMCLRDRFCNFEGYMKLNE